MTYSTIRRSAHAIIAFCTATGLAASAHAGVTILGNGLAKDCYEAIAAGWPNPRRALEKCDNALSNEIMDKRDRAATYVNRGILLMRIEKYEDSLASYDRSLRIEPDLAEAHTNRGAVFLLMNRPHDALDALNLSIEGEPTDIHAAYYNRAMAHERVGDVKAAYFDLKEALAAKPDFEMAQKQLERFEVLPAG